MKLGILKADTVMPKLAADFGEYPDMFIALLTAQAPDLCCRVYDVERGEYPDELDEVDAYLITGSKASVYDKTPWILGLTSFVQEVHRQRKKLVGICFGHQLIAQALGGRVEKSPKGWGVGLHTHRFSSLPSWHDQGDSNLDILVSHQDQVVRPAAGAQVLASSEFCDNAVSQVGEHILTLQGHPEFTKDYARALMMERRNLLDDDVLQAGLATLAGEQQGPRVAAWIARFICERK